MTRYAPIYENLFRTFDAVGRDEVTLREFFEVGMAMEPVMNVDRKEFLKRLANEKRRAHNLTRFALDAPRAVGLRSLNGVQNRYLRYRSKQAA